MMVAAAVTAKDLALEPWEVEFFTGLSQPAIRRMVADGKISTVQVDGRSLVPGSELVRLLRKQFEPKPSLSIVRASGHAE